MRHIAHRHATNPTKHFYLLKGLLKCAHCGTLFGGVISSAGTQLKNYYYCPKKERVWSKERIATDDKWKRGRVCSMTRSLDIETTDQVVWDAVMKAVSNSVMLKESVRKSALSGAENGTMTPKDRKALETKVKGLKKHISKLEEALTTLEGERLMGKVTMIQYPVIKNNISLENVALEGQIEAINTQLHGQEQRKQWIDWLKHFQMEINRYKDGTPEQKREVLQGLLTQIDVHLVDGNTHRLDIQFKLPLVGDALKYKDPEKKSLGYTTQPGSQTLPVEKKSRLYRRKTTIPSTT